VKKRGVQIRGFTIKDGKVIRIPGYGLNASAKIAQKKSKRIKPARGKHK
jgi:hypothetical protein